MEAYGNTERDGQERGQVKLPGGCYLSLKS